MQESICPFSDESGHDYIFKRRINQFFVGTEAELAKYPPHQMFIKMIPLFDSNGTHVAASANISIKTTLTLKTKKRRSALYAPTWGPFGWRDLYSAKSFQKRFAPSLIRYRTGGMRRTWQNVGDAPESVGSGTVANIKYPHPRETPYNWMVTNASGTGAGQTRSAPIVTYSKAQDKATIQTVPTPSRRRPKASIPDLDQIMEDTELPGTSETYPPIDQYRK